MNVTSRFYCALAFLSIAAFLVQSPLKAQDPTSEVRKTVDWLFEGMRTGDSTVLRNVFTAECSLSSISLQPSDSVSIHKSSIGGFIKAVGSPHKEIWNERIYDVKISIDGPMAIVWAPYKFYLGEKFSHCGVNVLMLIHTKAGWKINDITDTRRKEACP